MICCLCADAMVFFEERTCEEAYGCQCGEGFVGLYICINPTCGVSIVTVTEECETCKEPK